MQRLQQNSELYNRYVKKLDQQENGVGRDQEDGREPQGDGGGTAAGAQQLSHGARFGLNETESKQVVSCEPRVSYRAGGAGMLVCLLSDVFSQFLYRHRPGLPRRPFLKFRGACLAVLPALVDRLETVTVGIENIRSIITGIVIEARAGLAVVGVAPAAIAAS